MSITRNVEQFLIFWVVTLNFMFFCFDTDHSPYRTLQVLCSYVECLFLVVRILILVLGCSAYYLLEEDMVGR
jgi:hypothetical protein